ncbi:MAG: DUF2975 domain-containing protein [Christensenellaceae bacterium]|jgi:hypothetical protein|nr:DUF2975 domain-containing protein [Clostridia bacterium]
MENLKKIQTIGKISKIVALVVCVLAFVATGFALIGATVCASIPESWLSVSGQVNGTVEIGSSLSVWKEALERLGGAGEGSFGTWSVEGGKLFVSLRSPDFENIPLTKMAAVALTAAAFRLAFYGVILLFVSKFARALEKNSTPFCDACIKYLKITAFVLLGWAVVGETTLQVVCGMFFGKFRLGVSVNGGMILISLVFLLLAYIFQYGAKLQREADETL